MDGMTTATNQNQLSTEVISKIAPFNSMPSSRLLLLRLVLQTDMAAIPEGARAHRLFRLIAFLYRGLGKYGYRALGERVVCEPRTWVVEQPEIE